MRILSDGSAFFVGEVDTHPNRIQPYPVMWNQFNKVVQDHRDGTIDYELTNAARASRGLPIPWSVHLADIEVHEEPVW